MDLHDEALRLGTWEQGSVRSGQARARLPAGATIRGSASSHNAGVVHHADTVATSSGVPLAIPFVAGPSAMAALIMISGQEPERRMEWLVAVAVQMLMTGVAEFVASL